MAESTGSQEPWQMPVVQPDLPAAKKSKPFELALLFSPPQLACAFVQITHDLIEFQTLGSWAPIYFHEVLGVPLAAVLAA